MAKTCSGEAVPLVKLALKKDVCLRSKGEKVKTAEGAVQLIERLYGCDPAENFFGIFLSSTNEVLGVQQVSAGGMNSTQVDPRVLFSAALLFAGCTAVVLVHNHPAGALEPSAMDVALTRQLQEGAKLLGFRIADHIILARGGGHLSMRSAGTLPFEGEAL